MQTISRDLRVITLGEAHWLTRRQLNRTQAEAADKMGVSRHTYAKHERAEGHVHGHKAPLGVQCVLARRRMGWTLFYTAHKIGISHVTLLKWEDDSENRLVDWWKRKGWVFDISACNDV